MLLPPPADRLASLAAGLAYHTITPRRPCRVFVTNLRNLERKQLIYSCLLIIEAETKRRYLPPLESFRLSLTLQQHVLQRRQLSVHGLPAGLAAKCYRATYSVPTPPQLSRPADCLSALVRHRSPALPSPVPSFQMETACRHCFYCS